MVRPAPLRARGEAMKVLIFLAGVWVGAILVAAMRDAPPQTCCCCGGSGSGPAPATSVDIDTRGNTGSGGGGMVGKPSAEPTPSVGRIGYPGRAIIKLKPAPSPRSAHELDKGEGGTP